MSLRHYHHQDTDDKQNPVVEDNSISLQEAHEKTKRTGKNSKNSNSNNSSSNRNLVATFMICLCCCFLCCVSTFQLLRQLTSWTPPQPPPSQANFPETTDHAVVAAADAESTSRSVRRSKEPTSKAATPTTTRTAPPSSSSPWVIFYNIYIRPNSTNEALQSTLGILEDQLDQVGNSYATNSNYNNNNNNNNKSNNQTTIIDLYYNTIGAPHLVNNHSETISFFHNLCRRNHLNCIHMHHYDEGYETKTLVEVHRYCRRRASAASAAGNHHGATASTDDGVVIYLHNKGSFHDSNALHHQYYNNNTSVIEGAYSGQDSWRRAMTAAATSRQCLEQLILHENKSNSSTFSSHNENDNDNIHDDDVDICDACGLLFQPLPYEHYPGNMWSARCSYIQRLVNPYTLRAERAAMMEHLFQTSKQRQLILLQKKLQKQQGQKRKRKQSAATATAFSSVPPLSPPTSIQANLFPLANAMTGGDRYLSEFWLGSHPWLRPCDVSKTISLQYWKDHPYPPPQDDDDNFTTSSSSSSSSSTWELSHGPHGDIANTGWEYYKYMNPNMTDLLLQDTDATYNDIDDIDIDENDNDNDTNSSSSSSTLRRIRQQRQYQEFFLLPGQLFKWMYIYNATPRKDSWMWSWFPHGQEWKQITADADDSADSDQHHISSILTTGNTTTTTTTTTLGHNNTTYRHQNQTVQRFQQYYKEVTKQKKARENIM